MTTGEYVVIAVVLVAAVALLYVRDHRSRADRPSATPRAPATSAASVVEAREAARRAHMSADDRDWEAASLQRHQANQDRAEPGGDPSRPTGA
jgi:membrane protein implicated in regulation of membrane protease activity